MTRSYAIIFLFYAATLYCSSLRRPREVASLYLRKQLLMLVWHAAIPRRYSLDFHYIAPPRAAQRVRKRDSVEVLRRARWRVYKRRQAARYSPRREDKIIDAT